MGSKRTDIEDSNVHFMYEVEGKTQQDIADYYGVSQVCIYWRLHPDKLKEHSIKQRQSDEYKEYVKEYGKQWRLEHPDKERERRKNWRRYTEKGRTSVINEHARRRGLDSISLNKPFDGSEGHHIDEIHTIHIPAELHHSISHNVFTGEGMEAINEIAFQYIDEETFDKLICGEI